MQLGWEQYRDALEYAEILNDSGYDAAEFWAWSQTLRPSIIRDTQQDRRLNAHHFGV